MQQLRVFVSSLAAVAAIGWTSLGESADPVLGAQDLPSAVRSECARSVPALLAPSCSEREGYRSYWVSRSSRGDLFLVLPAGCDAALCRAWFVEKTSDGSGAVLSFEGQYEFTARPGSYPVIEVRTPLAGAKRAAQRYEWQGSEYVRTRNEVIYRVDGMECGSEADCRHAAEEALKARRVDEAVKIWEGVHNVSWI
jgi:hypothetical protein